MAVHGLEVADERLLTVEGEAHWVLLVRSVCKEHQGSSRTVEGHALRPVPPSTFALELPVLRCAVDLRNRVGGLDARLRKPVEEVDCHLHAGVRLAEKRVAAGCRLIAHVNVNAGLHERHHERSEVAVACDERYVPEVLVERVRQAGDPTFGHYFRDSQRGYGWRWTMMPQAEPLLLKPAEAALLLGVGRSKLYELIANGVIPSVVLGPRCTRVPRQAIERLAIERTH